MENIILTNNKDLRLVGVKVGVLSTLRFELPLVSASATRVEVIVTSGGVHSAYTATFIDSTKRWQCDIAASQFPAVGRQSYEIAYMLDGKQFWDGKGWIEIEDATTSGIEPQPRPEPYRYAVVSVNGYGADAEGAVRIPKTFIATNSPTTTDGFMEGDIYFNRLTGATWTLCDVQGTLTWVFNYSNYYTKAETDEQIDKLAAYYITSDVQGNPFATHAALVNAATYYSGGSVRVPTRNDYAVVLADETHGGAEYRYVYAVAEGQTTGSWQPQYPVEGVMTVDQTVTKNSQNPVSGGGVWSSIWGALSVLPTGFSSLYDWCVSQLAGKMPSTATGADIPVDATPGAQKIDAALAGKASTADATLTPIYSDTPTYSEWVIEPATVSVGSLTYTLVAYDKVLDGVHYWCVSNKAGSFTPMGTIPYDPTATNLIFTMPGGFSPRSVTTTRTRTDILGYVLGSQTDKLLASEVEAEALRQGKLASTSAAPAWVSGTAYPAYAFCSYNGVVYQNGNTAIPSGTTTTPDTSGSGWTAKPVSELFLPLTGGTMTGPFKYDIGGVAFKFAYSGGDWQYYIEQTMLGGTAKRIWLPLYDETGTLALAAPNPTAGNLAALDANGNPTDSQIPAANVALKSELRYSLINPTVTTGMDDTDPQNPITYGAVTLVDRAANFIQFTSDIDELRITLPAGVDGKVRDFGLAVSVNSGVTPPAITILGNPAIYNQDGTMPELAEGMNLLYFSEIGPYGLMLVKGEQVQQITQ